MTVVNDHLAVPVDALERLSRYLQITSIRLERQPRATQLEVGEQHMRELIERATTNEELRVILEAIDQAAHQTAPELVNAEGVSRGITIVIADRYINVAPNSLERLSQAVQARSHQITRESARERVAGTGITSTTPPYDRASDRRPHGDENDILQQIEIYLNSYKASAQAAVNTFVTSQAPPTDWNAFYGNLSGNLTWALASFATGGRALLVSLIGIVQSSQATLQARSFNEQRAELLRWCYEVLEGTVVLVRARAAETAHNIHQLAQIHNWGDNRTREAVLRALFYPQYLRIVNGGLPSLNETAIRTTFETQLQTAVNESRLRTATNTAATRR